MTPSPVLISDLGTLPYQEVLDYQLSLRDKKMNDSDFPDYLLFVEHSPVFTFGKNGGRENLMVSPEFLQQQGVDMVDTTRGGNVTYHGPGQIVLYPIIDIGRARIGVSDFVNGLEEIMIFTLAQFGVIANRDPKNHGIWIGPQKIGSVGLSIKKGISIHGLALNINMDLTPFSWVNPCGLKDVSMTSLKHALSDQNKDEETPSMAEIKEKMISGFGQIFNLPVKESKDYVQT